MSKKKNTIKKIRNKTMQEQLSFNFRPMPDDKRKRSDIIIKINPERYNKANLKKKETTNRIIMKFKKHSEKLDW